MCTNKAFAFAQHDFEKLRLTRPISVCGTNANLNPVVKITDDVRLCFGRMISQAVQSAGVQVCLLDGSAAQRQRLCCRSTLLPANFTLLPPHGVRQHDDHIAARKYREAALLMRPAAPPTGPPRHTVRVQRAAAWGKRGAEQRRGRGSAWFSSSA